MPLQPNVPGDTTSGPAPAQTVSAPSAPSAPASPLPSAGSGLWVGVALFGGIALSGTRMAPVVFGVLGVALIYQLNQLLQGK